VPRILVADDNANIQKMVSLSFEDRGVEVVSVGNGEAAVRRIPDVKPDLVLADIFMPVRSGYEVCEFVKKDSRFSHVPVILLVGAFDPLDEKEARRVGADGVLKKPFVPPDPLIAMVMSALEKNPKLAAELAKAKEAKQAPPPEPESIPEPATSIRAELKPLPSFPEPTPDEEAALYGTGSGRRTLEDVSISSETAKEPQSSVSEFDAAAEDELDGGATARDWRRSAMDLEIPADAANLPAFVESEIDSSIFPSERDVPPRRVSMPEPIEEIRSPQSKATVPVEPPRADAIGSQASTRDSDFFASSDAEAAQPESSAPVSESVGQAPVPALEPAAPQGGPSHWMDQLAQESPDSPPSDWMNVLSEQTAKATTPPVAEARPDDFAAPPAAHIEAVQSEPEHSGSVADSDESGDESFFADEGAPSLPSTAWFSPEKDAAQPSTGSEAEIERTAMDDVPVASKPEENLEVDSEPELPVAYQDPNLVQPPAIHVTPEPLLLHEEPAAPAQYASDQHQELEPLHLAVAPPAPVAAGEESPATEGSASPVIAEPLFEAQSAEAEINERIPTAPPPNREALAEIPFLTPPPDFFTHPAEPARAAAADPQTVDAVVQKVLEKLQPQLQDLLSQGLLKPLVENLLQSELTKKDQ